MSSENNNGNGKITKIANFLIKTKIISRITASAVIIYGLSIVNQYLTTGNIQPEVLAVAAGMFGAATTFLFMSEAK